MKKLSTAFAFVAWITLAASLLCGVVFAVRAESGGLLLLIYWVAGGGLSFMLSMSQHFLLKTAARVNEKMDVDKFERTKEVKAMQTGKTNAPVKPIAKEGYFVCPICGCQQASDKYCLECGAEFIKGK